MLTRFLRRPLGLWRTQLTQLRLALPQASLRLLELTLPLPSPVLAGAGAPCDADAAADPDDSLWFAVPKSRISKSKKRTKAHGRLQNLRFRLRSDWSVDEHTGRPVLRHRLLDSDMKGQIERVRAAKAALEFPDDVEETSKE
jgi:ribosomal protein L32